jgi:phage terminase small subunit
MAKEEVKPEDRPLTKKEAAFVDYLFICKLNGYAAAVKAGYSERSAYSIASENLRKPNIAKAIQARMAEVHLSSDEALAILSNHARGDIGQFVDEYGGIDLTAAQVAGITNLIKHIESRVVRVSGKVSRTPKQLQPVLSYMIHNQRLKKYCA